MWKCVLLSKTHKELPLILLKKVKVPSGVMKMLFWVLKGMWVTEVYIHIHLSRLIELIFKICAFYCL